MKIGIISDTHKRIGRAKKAIELLVSEGVEYIIHAGDVVKEEILQLLEETQLPYKAVIGNNDYHLSEVMDRYNLYSEPHYFHIHETKFKLMHHPLYMAPDVDIIIYGHTHIYDCDYKNGTLFLNPGEVCARDKELSTVIILNMDKENYKIAFFTRAIKQNKWTKRVTTYQKESK